MYMNFYFNLNIIFYFILIYFILSLRSRGSSVSIVSDYGLGDQAIEIRSPAEAREFISSLCVQTGSGTLLYNGYWRSFPQG
jgi:hypothetical protein